MVPKGLAAAVLASVPIQHGMVEGGDIQTVTYNVVLISIIVTSIAIPIIESTRLGLIFRKFFINKHDKDPDHDASDGPINLDVDDFTR